MIKTEYPWWPSAGRLFGGLLLLYHAWIVLQLSVFWSVTYNEVGHIPAGLSCWYYDDYTLYCVNPPLPRMVATIALVNTPNLYLEPASDGLKRLGERREFQVGTRFADTNAIDYQSLVCRARLAGVFWVTLGGFIVWRWAHLLFGRLSGLFVLALWTFEPTITAHAALATADVPAMVSGLLATWVFDRSLGTTKWLPTCAAGFLLGIACLCKFTSLLLAPAWIIASMLIQRRELQPSVVMWIRGGKCTRFMLLGFIAWLTLNAGYGFRGTGSRNPNLVFRSEAFKQVFGPQNDSIFARLSCLVPTAYLSGFDLQQKDFEGGQSSYLRGVWQTKGWWYYYIYAFGVKSPSGHLAIYFVALTSFLLQRKSVPAVLWVVPLLIVACASWKCNFTNHLRYILPAYPFLLIASGIVLSSGKKIECVVQRLLVFVFIILSGISVTFAYPHLLGYFNEAAGGSMEGWRHLGDSNVDWGQDLIFLRNWIDRNSNRRSLFVALYHFIDERLYLGQSYPVPHVDMAGLAIVDTHQLTGEFNWLLKYPIVARIGTSFFVFEVGQ